MSSGQGEHGRVTQAVGRKMPVRRTYWLGPSAAEATNLFVSVFTWSWSEERVYCDGFFDKKSKKNVMTAGY
jgi:hypothetical protein